MPLIKRVKFFVRSPIVEPTYAQDYTTHIMHGKGDHLYCEPFKAWFIIHPASEDIMFLKRESGIIWPSSWKVFRKAAGKRAYLELFEDQAGFRFKRIAQWIRKRIPMTKKVGWLTRIAKLDEDSHEWDKKAQKPIPGMGMIE